MNAVMEIREARAQALDAAKAIVDAAEAETRDLNETEQGDYDALLAKADELKRREERIVRLSEMIETRQAPEVLKIPRGNTEERAFCHYLRTGDGGGLRTMSEQRAYNNTDMNIGTAADGGYAVPTGLYDQIVARRDELALWQKLGCRPIPGVGLTVRVAIDNEGDTLFTSVAEANSINQDAPALYFKDFTLVKYAKYITLSWELLRDEDANLMAFINDWVSRGVAATENNLLVTEALASGTAGLTLDGAAAIDEPEIPELVGKLMPDYQDSASWLMHPTTWAYVQGLQGNPLVFAPTPGGSRSWSLWGYPAFPTSYMTALAASVKSMVFGNFNFMGRRQGTQLTVLRDPYTAAATGQTRMWFWFDVVYGVLQAEAIQYATHPSA